MSTSGAATPSCWKGKGSNERPSNTGACNIATPLPNIINQVSQSLRYFRPLPVSNHLTTDMLVIEFLKSHRVVRLVSPLSPLMSVIGLSTR